MVDITSLKKRSLLLQMLTSGLFLSNDITMSLRVVILYILIAFKKALNFINFMKLTLVFYVTVLTWWIFCYSGMLFSAVSGLK